MFNKPASIDRGGFVEQILCQAAALGVTKLASINDMSLVTLLCCLSRTWMFNKPGSEVSMLNI
jgi:hypothetical protein